MMKSKQQSENNKERARLEKAYRSEKPKLMARMRVLGRTFEEAEDLIHEVYTEVSGKLHLLSGVRNLSAWINWLFKRRVIDEWRHKKVREDAGELDVAEETLREIISDTGLDPLDNYVRDCLTDALNDAIKALPPAQREVIEAQVFGGKSFREIADDTGESINTLTARKRYALQSLTHALKHWIND